MVGQSGIVQYYSREDLLSFFSDQLLPSTDTVLRRHILGIHAVYKFQRFGRNLRICHYRDHHAGLHHKWCIRHAERGNGSTIVTRNQPEACFTATLEH